MTDSSRERFRTAFQDNDFIGLQPPRRKRRKTVRKYVRLIEMRNGDGHARGHSRCHPGETAKYDQGKLSLSAPARYDAASSWIGSRSGGIAPKQRYPGILISATDAP